MKESTCRILLSGFSAFCIMFLLSCGGTANTISNNETTASPSNAIPRAFFGLHLNGLYTETGWPTVSFGSLRLWDAGVTWHDLESQPSIWNFQRLDRIVQDAQQHGVEIDLVLGMTPTWASARPTERSAYGLGATAEPSNIEDWRNYVRILAERYRGRIHYWELWNEANLPQYYTGSMPQLITLCKEAYDVLKQVDPSNQVLTPAPNSGKWLGKFLEAGGGNYADILAFHFYHYPGTPEDLIRYFSGVRKVISDSGFGDKPVWNTEMGWGKLSPGQGPNQTFPDEHEAADYITRTMLLSWSAGITRVEWYAWNNRGWVTLYLTEPDHVTPTLAAKAYAELQNWLVGGSMKPCSQDSNSNYVCQLTSSSGIPELIAWNPVAKTPLNVPPGYLVQQATDIYGNQRAVGSGQAEVGPSPVLLGPAQ